MLYEVTDKNRRISIDAVLRRVRGLGGVIVLFPSAFMPLNDVLCYSSLGWSTATYQFAWSGSFRASTKDSDAAELLRELHEQGYDIRVIPRRTQTHNQEHQLQGAAWHRSLLAEGELLGRG